MTTTTPKQDGLPRFGEGAGDLSGQLMKYTSVGCYPIFYLDSECSVLCADCANAADTDPDTEERYRPRVADCNWEDPHLCCDVCGSRVESAYAEDELGNV